MQIVARRKVIKLNLKISPQAHQWFVSEMGAEKGDKIRFFGKYGGETKVHTGFSTGIEFSQPIKPLFTIVLDGITYFVEESDEWFFGGFDLAIEVNENQHGEPEYRYEPVKTAI